MIEIDIPTIDPMQHQPKIFLGMSSRQILCIVPGIALGVTLFMLTYKFSMDIAVISTALTVIPAACFGWLRPYNMKFEDYLKLIYFNTFVANQKRIYKTDKEEEVKLLTIKQRQELENKQRTQTLENKKKKGEKLIGKEKDSLNKEEGSEA